ncbi:anthranilate synthase component I family protein [Microbacterium xanthum]|uniref:anthranilate synthase component I family protein n=1 Tax=Microbacterium xanthum TaxID=3079794 RepID=UPI002AD3028C|nr:anthranilate synthase component I family protein [Microbacterium sp. KSW-48]MDZ8172445.1 anthranilate synthase component I family protein [Microbacterium sp. KSW-48]
MKTPSVHIEYPGWVDPEDVYTALCAESENSFWLDAGRTAADGRSWVGVGHSGRTHDTAPDVPAVGGAGAPGRWGPAPGGWVGWLDYDAAAARAGAPAWPPTAGARGMRVRWCIGFDHARRSVVVEAARDEAERLIRSLGAVRGAPRPETVGRRAATARHDPEGYADLIAACRRAICDGDAYQLCLTTRFEVTDPPDAVTVFRRLRAATDSHHGGLIRAGDLTLASASPERFLEVRGATVATHPIKGTRPRATDALHDRALAEALRESGKERAENVMIVDLMRNDLSRVCEPGSVRVPSLLEVESYPAVHQLVSTVVGRLRPEVTTRDLLGATFPAGSMTGAPKLAAMTILQRLENAPRGVFAGCFGWIGEHGGMDLAMVIRSVLIGDGRAVVGAGGGITWGSRAAAEVAEVAVKARAPLAAMGAELPPAWRDAAGW